VPLAGCGVVCSDDRVRRIARAHGARTIDDPQDAVDPLNAAIEAGAAALGGPVLVLTADLPCLTTTGVQAVLDAADACGGSAFVGDAAGTGTTMLAMRLGDRPAFGPRSRARHAAAGYEALDIAGELGARVRRDVDTPVDLWDAARIGVGPATQRVLDWSSAP
jgi:2-phospho-L-lactate guanylyltransferase